MKCGSELVCTYSNFNLTWRVSKPNCYITVDQTLPVAFAEGGVGYVRLLGRLATRARQTQCRQGKPLPSCLSVWQLTRVIRSKICVKERSQWDFILEA